MSKKGWEEQENVFYDIVWESRLLFLHETNFIELSKFQNLSLPCLVKAPYF